MAEDGHEASAGNRGPTDGPGGAASSGTPGAWKGATPASQDACACAASAVPLFPLLNVVLFPGAVLPLHIFEQRYRVMTADALGTKCAQRPDGRRLICMCRIREGHDPMDDQPPIYEVGCVGQVIDHEKLGDGRYNILLQGLCRVRVGREYPLGEGHDRKPYRRADLHPVACDKAFEIDVADAREKMKSLCRRPPIAGTPVGRQLEKLFCSSMSTVQLADVLAFDVIEDIHERQRLLEETDERRRVEQLVALLDRQFPDAGAILSTKTRFDVDEA